MRNDTDETVRAKAFVPDESQQSVIDAEGGYHMVLAPPGCGKTQILTERIGRAHSTLGIPYADMLCLTFTNRAARGMQERIDDYIDDRGVEDVFVGNLHRFCAHLLYSTGLVPAETAIIDEDDAVSILARSLGEDEYEVMNNGRRRREYATVLHLSTFMHQLRNAHPKALRIHPDCLSKDDVEALQVISRVQKKELTPEFIVDVYDHADTYRTMTTSDTTDFGRQNVIRQLLGKMEAAHRYAAYKQENRLVDFEDLLVLTYDALMRQPGMVRYPWIQVDEVQDLNPLQLAIVDSLVPADADFTVMYLGDEQQAIFSFMGAKLDTIRLLKERCGKNVHTLTKNHRSPDYLQAVFRTYQEQVLGGTPAQEAPATGQATKGLLRILRSDTFDVEVQDVVELTARLYEARPDETTALLVSSNSDADRLSQALRDRKLRHFKVSGDDIFASHGMKLLLAHLNILSNEHNFIAWARLLRGLGVCQSGAFSRNFVRASLNNAILPSDYLLYENSTYVQEFVKAFDEREIVVFDTETTGLNVFEDDIVQIAAVKMKGGEVVEGSEFCIFLDTDREIPRKLGDIDNPLIEALKHHVQEPRREGLRRFMDYVGDAVLMGHNAAFDVHILENNLKASALATRPVFDTLKLARLLEPELHSFKLKYLLEALHLEGVNSHLADDDVMATVSLAKHCYRRAKEKIEDQRHFLGQQRVQSRVETLRQRYSELFFRAQSLLWKRKEGGGKPVLVREMLYVYRRLLDDGLMQPLLNIGYVERFLSDDIISQQREPSLIEQLGNHIMEINTLKEADLCNSHTIDDRIFVTTVHKAKGLEFDNVIIFDAVDGRYPSFYSKQSPRQLAEDARRFYVAMSRARKRLVVASSLQYVDYYNQLRPRELTPFMRPIEHFFEG